MKSSVISEESSSEGFLGETYLAALKAMRVAYPDAEFIAVTRTARSPLAPSEDLLADFRREKARIAEVFNPPVSPSSPMVHNRAWDYVHYEERFRGQILGDLWATSLLHEIGERAKTEKIFLVCYEKSPPKNCHRFILLDLIHELAKRTSI